MLSPVLVTGRKWPIGYLVYVLTVSCVAPEKKNLVLNVECVGEAGLKPGFSVFYGRIEFF